MSIDSRDKRASIIGMSVVLLLPAPEGALDEGDRQQLVHLYRTFTPSIDIDARDKRASIVGMGIAAVLPVAQGFLEQGDRQQLVHLYRTFEPPGEVSIGVGAVLLTPAIAITTGVTVRV